jgi:hypothetical protein
MEINGAMKHKEANRGLDNLSLAHYPFAVGFKIQF